MDVKASKSNIIETIGNTPLVKLQKASQDLNTNVYAKIEAANPGHSAKDRVALYVVNKAEKEGKLKPGGTIIESTSGNTGRSLAMIAAIRGYRCILCTTTKISFEKRAVLEAYGAEVIVCPKEAKADDKDSYYSRAASLNKQIPNSIYVNQYYNESNIAAHYSMTGPEIWDQTEGTVTHYIAAVGSGGTISGTAKFLKEQKPSMKVFGVDAHGSVLTKYHTDKVFDEGEIAPYNLEGVGKNIIPTTVLFDIIDKFQKVEDGPSLLRARELARTESLLIGPSGGAVLEGLYQLKDEFKPTDCVVLVFPDHGMGYLSKLYSDEWMVENGFMEKPEDEHSLIKKSSANI